jgi:hypothetical protein
MNLPFYYSRSNIGLLKTSKLANIDNNIVIIKQFKVNFLNLKIDISSIFEYLI